MVFIQKRQQALDYIDGTSCAFINGKRVFSDSMDSDDSPEPVEDYIDGIQVRYVNGKRIFGSA